jgi:GTP-binding protein
VSRPLVALVGRPNVGKSRLFNRLIGQRQAIVEDIPGTTRDRLYGHYTWNGREVGLVDTGGLTTRPTEVLAQEILAQASIAIEEADTIVMVVDVRNGVLPVDRDIAQLLRKGGKPIVLASNKADNVDQMSLASQFFELALGDPVPVSAERGLGTGDLLDQIDAALPPEQELVEEDIAARLAIVGRPNVGKSSIVNALLGEKRVVVSDKPGTTRDAVDTPFRYHGKTIVLVDTAGIRRRGKVEPGIEKYSVLRAHRAIDRCDVAALVIDATDLLVAQDAHIAGFVRDEGKGIIVVVNKWDLIEKTGTTINEFERRVRRELKFVDYAPMLFISALTKQRLANLPSIAISVGDERRKRIQTSQLNEVVRKAIADYQPPARQGKRVHILYATQVSVEPPTFVFFVNDPKLIHFTYERFLENRIRERFGFMGAPIRISFRSRRPGDHQTSG